ncbi:MAG: glutathione S-transferase [Planctomycetaceae bacterium]|nr:glutathione S-transferase [Planctomycetaceae bacterium]
MERLTLVIGSQNYSSWSLRAWAAARLSRLAFETQVVHFDEDTDRSRRWRLSPTGKVPALHHGSLVLWDSLAIAEYLCELAPEAELWPKDRTARAIGRAMAAEMHSGFADLRRELPMNVRRARPAAAISDAARADIQRVVQLWEESRARFQKDGQFLLGRPSIADAFYAPVASRLRSYGVALSGAALAYQETVLRWEPMVEWTAAALAEGHGLAAYDQLP